MKRSIQLAIGLAVSLGCLVLAARGLALDEVARALASAEYPWLLPALALYFAGVWVRAVRWRYLLAPIQHVSAARLFPVVVIGYMANDVLPFRLGEVARCYVLRRREGIPQPAALGSVLLERVMDGLTMLTFMAATVPFLTFTAELYGVMGFAAVLFIAVLGGLVLLAVRPALALRLLDLVLRPVPAGIGGRVRDLVTSFLTGLGSLGGAGAALRVFALSCAAWLLEAGMYYVLMYAFPLAPSVALAVLTTAVANFGALIPSTPGYVGVFEAAGMLALSPFGLPQETALAYILVVHAALVVPVTLLGFYYTWRDGVALNRLGSAA